MTLRFSPNFSLKRGTTRSAVKQNLHIYKCTELGEHFLMLFGPQSAEDIEKVAIQAQDDF